MQKRDNFDVFQSLGDMVCLYVKEISFLQIELCFFQKKKKILEKNEIEFNSYHYSQ